MGYVAAKKIEKSAAPTSDSAKYAASIKGRNRARIILVLPPM